MLFISKMRLADVAVSVGQNNFDIPSLLEYGELHLN